MDENAGDFLKEIRDQVTKLNYYLKIMLFCVAAVALTLIAEVWRHW